MTRPLACRNLRGIAAAALLALWAGCTPAVSEDPARGGVAGNAEIPAPQPVSTGPYQIGVYYFPGWPTQEKWRVLDRFPERMPLLGYYREGDPDVMDWQIKWAVEHGISFFAFDWYWTVATAFSSMRSMMAIFARDPVPS